MDELYCGIYSMFSPFCSFLTPLAIDYPYCENCAETDGTCLCPDISAPITIGDVLCNCTSGWVGTFCDVYGKHVNDIFFAILTVVRYVLRFVVL